MLTAERYVEATIKLILSHEKFRFQFLSLWEQQGDLPIVARSIIENHFDPELSPAHELKIRVHPPSPHLLPGHRSQYSVAASDLPIHLPGQVYAEIEQIKRTRREKYGKSLTETVDELPTTARAQYVVPAIIQRIQRIREEEKKTVLEMDSAGYLDVAQWKVSY